LYLFKTDGQVFMEHMEYEIICRIFVFFHKIMLVFAR